MPRPTFSSRLLDGCVRLGLSIAVVVSGLPAIATPIDFSGSTYTQDFQGMTGSTSASTTNTCSRRVKSTAGLSTASL